MKRLREAGLEKLSEIGRRSSWELSIHPGSDFWFKLRALGAFAVNHKCSFHHEGAKVAKIAKQQQAVSEYSSSLIGPNVARGRVSPKLEGTIPRSEFRMPLIPNL